MVRMCGLWYENLTTKQRTEGKNIWQFVQCSEYILTLVRSYMTSAFGFRTSQFSAYSP